MNDWKKKVSQLRSLLSIELIFCLVHETRKITFTHFSSFISKYYIDHFSDTTKMYTEKSSDPAQPSNKTTLYFASFPFIWSEQNLEATLDLLLDCSLPPNTTNVLLQRMTKMKYIILFALYDSPNHLTRWFIVVFLVFPKKKDRSWKLVKELEAKKVLVQYSCS